MRFIKASWKGYEIDSSEFWVEITSSDVPRLIKAFMESPFIEGSGEGNNRSGDSYLPTLKQAIELAKSEDEQLLQSIRIGDKSLLELVDKFEKEGSDLLELSIAVKFLLQDFPHLSFEFNNCASTFYRKSNDPEGTNRYTFSLTGAPIKYMVQWYTEEEWNAVLQSINKKAPVSWNTWI